MFLRILSVNIRPNRILQAKLHQYDVKNICLNTLPAVVSACSKPLYTSYSTSNFKEETKKKGKAKNHGNAEERSLLLQKNDPDVFGDISITKATVDESVGDDEGDIAEEEFTTNLPLNSQQLTMKQYANIIKEHFKYKRIKEAIDVLEVKMIQVDRVKPEQYIYNLLIGELGRLGYSKKAFRLYNKMKQRGLTTGARTYTGLFNSLANSPFTTDSLEQANKLRRIMIEKGYEPNEKNYNAMIKTYGRCNDLKNAFELVDEMKEKKLQMKLDTYNFLLQACNSDKEYGFRHALIVWHKIYQRNLKPDIYSFNLILRCVRDCSIGDFETMQQVIATILLQSKENLARKAEKRASKKKVQLSDGMNANEKDIAKNNNQIEISENKEDLQDITPNLLSDTPHLGNLIELKHIRDSGDRLLLLGGISGFISEMEKAEVVPDIKTFTQLMDVIPSTEAAEHKLITQLRKAKVTADVDFFNMLMKKRSMRKDYIGAKTVLDMIDTANLQPDIVTYGVLSLGCTTREEAQDLLQKMHDAGIQINIIILGAMLRNACYAKEYNYVLEVMHICKMERIKPSERFVEILEEFNKKSFNFVKYNSDLRQSQRNAYFKFSREYKDWLRKMKLSGLDKKELKKVLSEHPWKQFKEKQSDGLEDIKNHKKWNKKKQKHSLRKLNETKLQKIEKKHKKETDTNETQENDEKIDKTVNNV